MGSTRVYAADPTHPEFTAGWPQLVQDARRIADAVAERGVSLRGGFGEGEPVFSAGAVAVTSPFTDDPVRFEHGAIWFNGDEDRDEDAEALLVHPGQPTQTWSVRTASLPYDLAVAAVLLRAQALMPGAVTVGDGEAAPTGEEWDGARAFVGEVFAGEQA